jgi:hypothetical protein
MIEIHPGLIPKRKVVTETMPLFQKDETGRRHAVRARGEVRVKMLRSMTGTTDESRSQYFEEGAEYVLPTGPHPLPDFGVVALQKHPCWKCVEPSVDKKADKDCEVCKGTGKAAWAVKVGEEQEAVIEKPKPYDGAVSEAAPKAPPLPASGEVPYTLRGETPR